MKYEYKAINLNSLVTRFEGSLTAVLNSYAKLGYRLNRIWRDFAILEREVQVEFQPTGEKKKG